MRRAVPALIFFLLLGGVLWAGDIFSFSPKEIGSFFFPGEEGVLQNLAFGEEELLLDYGEWQLLMRPGFLPSGRTLLQIYYNSRRSEGYSLPSRERAPFSRSWQGGTLTFSPLKPDSLTLLSNVKEDISLDRYPEGLLLFFEAGGDFFWLGNGTDFFCYDRSGRCVAEHSLLQTALQAAADREGRLYLTFPDDTILALPSVPVESNLSVRDVSFSPVELVISHYEEARSLLDGTDEARKFDLWILTATEKLYREDPLNRELGVFLRSLGN
ncbi:MAG: hypothetical protein PQJ60_09790 [Spirochaetales bacterium]|nr:hypothetical protein [Spirochaetales bacterium]